MIEPEDRRSVPALVADSLRLIWSADPVTTVAVFAAQLVGGLGLAVLLLLGRATLARVLEAPSLGSGLLGVAPQLGILVGLMAVLSFANASQAGFHRRLAERTVRTAQARVLEVAAAVPLERFESSAFYDRLRRAREHGHQAPLQIALHLPAVTGGAVSALGITAALAAIQPLLVPIVAVGAVPLWIAATRNADEMYSFSYGHTPEDRVREHLATLLTTKEAAPEVRAFELSGFLRGRWTRLFDERLEDVDVMVRRFLRRSVVASVLSTIVTALSLAGLAFLLVTGRMDAAGAVAAVVAIQQLGSRLQGMGTSAAMLYENVLYLDDYRTFLGEREAVPPSDNGGSVEPFTELRAENLRFTYPGSSRPALDGVSLEIRRGEVVALVGENGSGKTTLAKLLSALYTPDGGRILWDGVDTASIPAEAMRARIAPIFQDFVRYRLPAVDNIVVGDVARATDPDALREAADRAGARAFLEALPQGYETVLGKEFEDGTDLSGGQWQRIALARAFFRDAPFIILDEPTAALDARAEYELFERIRTLCTGRAVLLISHRFSTVRSADRIYVLHDGRIVESGTHAELMQGAGRYAELFTMQASSYVDASSVP